MVTAQTPPPRARKAKKDDPPTRKHVMLTYRSPDADAPWRTEHCTMTSFNLSASGALTLFYRKCPQKILAPGLWAEVALLQEEYIGPNEA